MNPILFDLLPHVRKGECCSQLLLRLALQTSGEDNPALVRAMWGFCQGLVQNGQTCGVLLGGVAVLAYYAGLGPNGWHPMAVPLLGDYVDWFNSLEVCANGNTCPAVASALTGTDCGLSPPADMTPCADLIALAWEKIVELAAGYAIDLTEIPDDGA